MPDVPVQQQLQQQLQQQQQQEQLVQDDGEFTSGALSLTNKHEPSSGG